MTWTSKKKWKLLVIIVAASCFCFLAAVVTMKLRELDGVERGTFAFYFGIGSDLIKECPVLSPVERPEYFSRWGDPGLASDGVIYHTSMPEKDVLQKLDRYIVGAGFLSDEALSVYAYPDGGHEWSASYKKQESRVNVHVYQKGGPLTVVVHHYYE